MDDNVGRSVGRFDTLRIERQRDWRTTPQTLKPFRCTTAYTALCIGFGIFTSIFELLPSVEASCIRRVTIFGQCGARARGDNVAAW